MTVMGHVNIPAATSAYRLTGATGDSTVVIAVDSGDVWVGTATFTVPSDWATTTSGIPAFRIASGKTVTLRLGDGEGLWFATNATDACFLSYSVSSD